MNTREIIQNYIETWQNRCYSELPDEAPQEIDHLVPSYKKIAICILKNDFRELGYQRKESKWYGVFKRIEIENRQETKQLKLL